MRESQGYFTGSIPKKEKVPSLGQALGDTQGKSSVAQSGNMTVLVVDYAHAHQHSWAIYGDNNTNIPTEVHPQGKCVDPPTDVGIRCLIHK